jgi:transposase
MLRPEPLDPVPAETAHVCGAAFPKGHSYLRLADQLDGLFTDELFTALFPTRGQPAFSPWRLALVSILQFAEGLSDRQAADAVRSRLDWKYVLRLELTDPGFDASVLSEFRARLIAGSAEFLLFDTLLNWCVQQQLLKARGRQRTDSTNVLAAVRALNRLELVTETMRATLNALAVVAPDWLHAQATVEWGDRYARRAEDDRLPSKETERQQRKIDVGRDGVALLTAIYQQQAPGWLRQIPAVEIMRQVWLQNYCYEEEQLRWREADNIPPASIFISSPYDAQAHYARKRSTQWVGYKVHLTESCDDDLPHLITHVETAAGPSADGDATPKIHAALQRRSVLPQLHIVDTGFLDAALLVESKADYDVDLLGPTRADHHWQARAGEGFAAGNFELDWERREARCPAGKTSLSWSDAVDRRSNQVIKIKFSSRDCRRCALLSKCVRSQKKYPRRTLTVRRAAAYQALQAARAREASAAFAAEYDRRAGIEGTISRGVRTLHLRQTPYIGRARTRLGHILTGVALNFLRLGEWFMETPVAKTRRAPFQKLMAPALAA